MMHGTTPMADREPCSIESKLALHVPALGGEGDEWSGGRQPGMMPSLSSVGFL